MRKDDRDSFTPTSCVARVNQSVILPIWGDYGGSTGVILQYLSLGEEVVIWARRGKSSNVCDSFVKKFVVACTGRGDQFHLTPWDSMDGYEVTYDRTVNSYLPTDSLYSPATRQNFFHHSLEVNETVEKTIQIWRDVAMGAWMGPDTEEIGVQWIVVSPVTRIITLVQASAGLNARDAGERRPDLCSNWQVSFITNRESGDIHPGFSIWSFAERNGVSHGFPAEVWKVMFSVLFCLLLIYFFVLEVFEMIGSTRIWIGSTIHVDEFGHMGFVIGGAK